MNTIYIVILVSLVLVLILTLGKKFSQCGKDGYMEGFVGETPCYGDISSKTRLGDDYYYTNYMLDTNKNRNEVIGEQKTQDITTINALQSFKNTMMNANDTYQNELRQFRTLNENMDDAFNRMNMEVGRNVDEANSRKNTSLKDLNEIGTKIGSAIAGSAGSSLEMKLRPVVQNSLDNQLNDVQNHFVKNNMASLVAVATGVSDVENDIYNWQYLPELGDSAIVRVDPISGEVQCLSYDGKNCDREWVSKNGTDFSKIDNSTVKPLSCGAEHKRVSGVDGYSDPNHWCSKVYNHFAGQSVKNNNYTGCPKNWKLIDANRMICQAPTGYNKCPSVQSVKEMYPEQCSKNSCAYFNQPDNTYDANAKREWAKNCNAQYPFLVGLNAIQNGLTKSSNRISQAIREKIGTPSVNNFDQFKADKNGIIVRAYRLTPQSRRGEKIFENVITSTINYRWGAGTIMGIEPNGSDRIFLDFSGFIKVPRGVNSIRFRLGSDDGSQLMISTKGDPKNMDVVISMMNLQPHSTKESSNINVEPESFIAYVVEFYENEGLASLVLEWSLNGGPFQVVPRDVFFYDKSLCANNFEMSFKIPGLSQAFLMSNLMAWNVDEQLWTAGLPNQIYEQIIYAARVVASNLAIGNNITLKFNSGGGSSNGLTLGIQRVGQNTGIFTLSGYQVNFDIPAALVASPEPFDAKKTGFYLLPPNIFNGGEVSPLQLIPTGK